MVNTDWVLLKELKACVGDAALKKKMDQTDPHTRYIFEKGYSKKRLPHWSHHARVTETLVTREEDGGNVVNTGQKKKINQFFQLGVPTFFERNYTTFDLFFINRWWVIGIKTERQMKRILTLMYFLSPCLFDLAIEKVNSGGC